MPASALVPGAVGSLRLYEMHSNFVHDLLRKARTTASERGYRHVWARDGVVCVRKSDGADVIELFSESDLESLL
uniref:FP protein C-terminal domain-containing protein n=1 Tax=Trichogramma kaykai TaxID=54128 RepID=A0ABD2X2A9_9HYME